MQVARGNWISRAPSPGTFRTFIFRQFWECKIVKNAPHRSGNGILFRIFVPPNSVRFRFFCSERFRVKRWEFRPRHGYNFLYATFVETATFQPKTARQTFNHTSSGHVGSTAMGFCPRNLKHTSASHRISGSLSWFAHNCNL